MEFIIKIYGKFLLEAVIVGMFLLLLLVGIRDEHGNIGVFHMIGSCLEEEQTVLGGDFTNFAEESKRSAPQIFYKKEEAVCLGSYNTTDLFGSIDCEGAELLPQVQAVYNLQGDLETEAYDVDTMQISFHKPGIYTVQVCAVDLWNRESVCKFQVPVNTRGKRCEK